MPDLIPTQDMASSINPSTLIDIIHTTIYQVTIDEESLVINLNLLIHTPIDPSKIFQLIHNICIRLSPESELLEILCILYLKSINFNIEYFLIKNRISEKHDMRVKFTKEVYTRYIKSLSDYVYKYVDNMEGLSDRAVRIFCVYVLMTHQNKDDERLNIILRKWDYDIFFFIQYIIHNNPLIIEKWILSKPTKSKWDILKIQTRNNFVITELKYVKSVEMLLNIKSSFLNYKFIEYIDLKIWDTPLFYRLIVESYDPKYVEYTKLILQYVHKKNIYVYVELIKKIMFIDKVSLNEFILDNINEDMVEDIVQANHKIIDIFPTKFLLQILYSKSLPVLFSDFKTFKCLMKSFYDKNILDLGVISKHVHDIKRITYIYKKYDIRTSFFYDKVIKLIKKSIYEYKELTKKDNIKKNNTDGLKIKENIKYNQPKIESLNNLKDGSKKDKTFIELSNDIREMTYKNIEGSREGYNFEGSFESTREITNTFYLQEKKNNDEDKKKKTGDEKNYTDDSLDISNSSQIKKGHQPQNIRYCDTINEELLSIKKGHQPQNIRYCDTINEELLSIKKGHQPHIEKASDFSIFFIKNEGSCKCFSRKTSRLIKLFFIYNNPNIPKYLIYYLYVMNKKSFMRYFNNITEYNTLYIKIYKMLYKSKTNLNLGTDYWTRALFFNNTLSASDNDISLHPGLYFNKSYIRFTTDSRYFTLNIFFIQYSTEGAQILVSLFNNKNQFILGIKDGIIYQESTINGIRLIKDIVRDPHTDIYIEIGYFNKKLVLSIDNKKYFLDIFRVSEVYIGDKFKGIITKILYYESVKYTKSRILHLDNSELYINILRNVEMYCVSRSISGMYIGSKKVYWWYKKKEVEFYNIIDIT
jgi:hypothetical protein